MESSSEIGFLDEFSGRIVYFCTEGNSIWAYDEISKGVYEIDQNVMTARCLLTPEQLRASDCGIRGFIKKGRQLILVPGAADRDWMLYDLLTGSFTCFPSPLRVSMFYISEVAVREGYVYILPETISDPVAVLKEDNLELLHLDSNWFDGEKYHTGGLIFKIFGSVTYKEGVCFPVVSTHFICKVDRNGSELLSINIPDPIYSISVYDDRIWILPKSGNFIYVSDLCGKIMDKLDLTNIEQGISAGIFGRIVAVGGNVILCDVNGPVLYAYHAASGELREINHAHTRLLTDTENMLLRLGNIYWTHYISENKIFFLPCGYRYMSINIDSFEASEKAILFSEQCQEDAYCSMFRDALKAGAHDELYEINNESLSYFIRLLDCDWLFGNREGICSNLFGKKIWEHLECMT